MEHKIDNALIQAYIKDGKRHGNYDKAVNIYNHLSFHIDGYEYGEQPENPYFRVLIDDVRPSESVTIKNYRRKIYKPKTKKPCYKVMNSLKKIIKSKDWKIDYSKSETPKIVGGEENSLEFYCEKKYPMFKSLENWLYSYGIKEILTDPNGAVVIMPTSFEVDPNEYVQPFTYYIPSKKIYDYVDGELIVFESSQLSKYTDNGVTYTAPIIYAMDKNTIWSAKKMNANNEYSVELAYTHNIGMMPAFLGGGVYRSITDNTPLYDSFLSAMLPDLDTASREGSDLDASVIQHLFPTMWYMSGDNCGSCSGTGKTLKEGEQVVCPDCKGAGVMEKTPYKDMVIKKEFMQTGTIPTPPAGYVTKPTEIVELQDTRIQNHITSALSAINMEFLAQTPLNESGLAKEVDRDELNNFVYGVAYHFVENVLKPAYFFINEYRYKTIVTNDKERYKMLPFIPVPEQFDLLNEGALITQLTAIKDADVDPVILAEMQIDFINKHFRNQPEVRDKLIVTNRMNPFVGMGVEHVNDMLLAKTITKADAVRAMYVDDFVERGMVEHKDFLLMDSTKQNDIIQGYTDEKVKSIEDSQPKPIEIPPMNPDEDE